MPVPRLMSNLLSLTCVYLLRLFVLLPTTFFHADFFMELENKLRVANALRNTGLLTLPAGQQIVRIVNCEEAAPALYDAFGTLACVATKHGLQSRVEYVRRVARECFPCLFIVGVDGNKAN